MSYWPSNLCFKFVFSLYPSPCLIKERLCGKEEHFISQSWISYSTVIYLPIITVTNMLGAGYSIPTGHI